MLWKPTYGEGFYNIMKNKSVNIQEDIKEFLQNLNIQILSKANPLR